MLRDSLGHEQALDFKVDGEPRLALAFSLDDRDGRDGWVIRRLCYMGRSSHNGFAIAIRIYSIIASRRRDPGRSAVRSECSQIASPVTPARFPAAAPPLRAWLRVDSARQLRRWLRRRPWPRARIHRRPSIVERHLAVHPLSVRPIALLARTFS